MLSEILKRRRSEMGLTLLEIANKMGVSEATVQRWESGNIKSLRHNRISKLAEILNVEPAILMGWEDNSIPLGFQPLPKFKKVPRLGAISCGEPLLSEENLEGYDSIPENIDCDFTLKCEGDSMINARINDGDIVYIKQQPIVENGQIAAVLIDGEEKLLKRVYMTNTAITLTPENPKYSPLVFVGEEMNRVSIIGRAVGFYSNIK